MKNLDVNELEMIQGGISQAAACGVGVGLVAVACFTGGASGYVGAAMIGMFCFALD